MRMLHSQLEKLSVRTESGDEVGKLADAVYDIDSYTIVQLRVVTGLIRTEERMIHVSQIRSITDEAIIVDDTVILAEESSHSAEQIPGAAGVVMCEDI